MATIKLDIPQLLMFGTTKVTDHNREPLAITVERIEKKQRMANGRMRKYVVADKRTFATSWTMLPGPTARTVEGYAGADAIEAFYNTTPGEFPLTVTFSDSTTKVYTVMFSDFSKTLSKRGAYDFYEVSLSMEEV